MNQEEFEHCAYAGCKRKILKTSKDRYCIFHAKAEEKDVREFDKDLKDYIEEIKIKDLDYNFNGFIFLGDINFRKYFEPTVFKDVYFGAAEFYGDVHFEGVKFQKNVHFEKVDFWKNAGFQEAKFRGDAYFQRVEFHGIVVFVKGKISRKNLHITQTYQKKHFVCAC